MERLSSFTILNDGNELLRLASSRVGVRCGQIYGWFKDKSRQIRSLTSNDDLAKAVLSAEKSPVEGSRYQVGERLNVYHADGECRRLKICGIQCGGFSNVYTVIDLDEMKPYCLKENRALPGDERKKNERLAVEAEISLRLGLHPNLVTTYAAFFIRNRLFILTEYLPSTSLDMHLRAGLLSLNSAMKYAVQLCRAVHYAQAKLPGFVHGDIKPGNCLVTSKGIIKLGDFGLASAAGLGKHPSNGGQDAIPQTTKADTNIGWGGTAAYMAPEMFDRNGPERTGADIYAFGVTLFEMLCGIRPFVSSSKSELIEMHRHKEPPLELLSKKNVPRAIADLVRRCLAKSPEQRPKSFESVEKELLQVLEDQFKKSVLDESISELTESEIVSRALSFAELENYEQAAACIDSAVEYRGQSPELLACKAIALASGGCIDDAYDASTAALRTQADVFVVLLAHARVQLSRGNLDSAGDYLYRALQHRADNCVALNLMGYLCTRIEQYEEASIHFDRSLTLDAGQAEPLDGLAKISFLTGRVNKAIRLAEKALLLDPMRSNSHKLLGDFYLSQDQLFKAIKSYKAALSFASYSKETACTFVGVCCGLYETSGHRIDRQLVRTLLKGTRLLSNSDEPRASARDFAKKFLAAFRNSDFNPLLLFFLDGALCAAAIDLDSDVSEELLGGLKIVWERSEQSDLDSHLWCSVGRVFYHLERYEDCQNVFRKVLRRFGPNENSFYYLAACSEVQDDFKTSLIYYKKALLMQDTEDSRTGIKRVAAKIRHPRNTAAQPLSERRLKHPAPAQ